MCNNYPSIDVFPLKKCTISNGGVGSTGPTGPAGKRGKNGTTGPAGSDFELTTESFVYDGSEIAITPDITVTFLTNTCCEDAVVTLANGNEGDVKYIYLRNSTLPIQVQTLLGSFSITANNPQVQLLFQNGQWIQLSDDTPWYANNQQAKLVGSDVLGTIGADQGTSVTLSSDGNTLAIGGISDNNGVGATWIFTRSNNNTWTQQAKLIGTGGIGTGIQGSSVGLSADGNTLAVGARTDNTSVGATYIFIRSGTNWSQQDKLIGTDGGNSAQQGTSVALSADGDTLAIGGRTYLTTGASWVFTRTAGSWSEQQSQIVGTGGSGANQQQGTSIALSADGNTMAVGALGDNPGTQIGATWVFTRSGTSWSQQGSKLVGTDSIGSSAQGTSTALSADGNTLAVGGNVDDSNVGAIWVFTRSGTEWSQQGSKLVGSESVGTSNQGQSIALSSNGNTLVFGGDDDNSLVGAVWIFTRFGNAWTQQGTKVVGSGAIGSARQGVSITLSANGNTMAVGGILDDDGGSDSIGATWVYV